MSSGESDLSAYPKGSLQDCKITRVEPFGVFVRLVSDDRIPGFIHRQDWSWSKRVFDLEGTIKVGETVRARVLRHQQRELRLGRRQAEPDPYPAFRREHRIGDVVIGHVDLFSPNGAGVILSLGEGIDGFVPRSEIPAAGLDLDGFGLLIQDRVAACILRFADDRTVLSIKDHLRRRDEAAAARRLDRRGTLRYHPTLGVDLESLFWQYQLREMAVPEISQAVREKIRRVLVVEDSDNVSESLEMVFHHFGFHCEVVGTVEVARRLLQEHDYDLLVLDQNLPAQRGVHLVRELDSSVSPVCVFVLTGASAGDWSELIAEENDPRISVFQKPTSVVRLFQRLEQQVGSGPGESDDRDEIPGLGTGLFEEEEEERPLSFDGGAAAQARQRILNGLLEDLRQETGASRALLIGMRSGPVFELVAGEFVPLTREVQQKLDISPIGNLIRERDFFATPETDQQKARFRHLLDVCPLSSFAGIALEYEDQVRYGLFLFGDRPQQLRGATRSRLMSTARELGRHLAQGRFEEALSENQGLLLTGFLADSLLHEIKNELQALQDYATVQLEIGHRHKEQWNTLGQEEGMEFTRATVGIQKVSDRLSELVVLFRNLAGRSPAERVDLGHTLERLQETIQPFADDRGVTLDLEVSKDLPEILVHPRLLDQPLLNLMINGIEQMALRGGSPRRLRVDVTWQPEEEEFPIVVSVADTGRGIHWVDRGKIFDLFFTTKDQGTGLGLYVSRFFVERFGGRLVLRESLMFSGSEFAVEIPKRLVV